MLNASEAPILLPYLDTGVLVPQVSISLAVIIHKLVRYLLRGTSILKVNALLGTRAFSVLNVKRAMSEMPSSSVLSAQNNGGIFFYWFWLS